MCKPRTAALLLALVLLFTLPVQATEESRLDVAPFSADDLAVSYLYAGAAKADVQALFGEPENLETLVLEATGDIEEIWTYDGFTLTLTGEGQLIAADVTAEGITGPRGIQVGQTAQEIISRFYRSAGPDDSEILYTSGYVEAYGVQLPPYGFMRAMAGDTFTVEYAAPLEPFSSEVLQDPTNYMYETLALLTIVFSKDAVAQRFIWILGPWAE